VQGDELEIESRGTSMIQIKAPLPAGNGAFIFRF